MSIYIVLQSRDTESPADGAFDVRPISWRPPHMSHYGHLSALPVPVAGDVKSCLPLKTSVAFTLEEVGLVAVGSPPVPTEFQIEAEDKDDAARIVRSTGKRDSETGLVLESARMASVSGKWKCWLRMFPAHGDVGSFDIEELGGR